MDVQMPKINLYGSYPTVLLLNKLHLFSLTQHRFVIIPVDYVYTCATCFGLYLGHPQACQYKNLIKKVALTQQDGFHNDSLYTSTVHNSRISCVLLHVLVALYHLQGICMPMFKTY